MWTENNTSGFSKPELEMINAVRQRILNETPAKYLEAVEDTVDDLLNDGWSDNITEEKLYNDISKRLGR